MKKYKDNLQKNNQMQESLYLKKWEQIYSLNKVTQMIRDSQFLEMMITKHLCGDHSWKTVLSTMMSQKFQKKLQWKKLFKENMMTYSKKDGGQHSQVGEICSHGHAINIIRALLQEKLRKRDMLIAKIMLASSWNLVQIMIDLDQSLVTSEDFLID